MLLLTCRPLRLNETSARLAFFLVSCGFSRSWLWSMACCECGTQLSKVRLRENDALPGHVFRFCMVCAYCRVYRDLLERTGIQAGYGLCVWSFIRACWAGRGSRRAEARHALVEEDHSQLILFLTRTLVCRGSACTFCC